MVRLSSLASPLVGMVMAQNNILSHNIGVFAYTFLANIDSPPKIKSLGWTVKIL